jgi:O-antigen/teichoic acid export membrane protein
MFGDKYPDAAGPLAILAIGMGLYGFYTVMGSVWVGLGRPGIDPIATGIAMACTVIMGLTLIPRMGLDGAALAFTVGAAARLVVIAAFTLWTLSRRRVHTAEMGATLQPQT